MLARDGGLARKKCATSTQLSEDPSRQELSCSGGTNITGKTLLLTEVTYGTAGMLYMYVQINTTSQLQAQAALDRYHFRI